MNTLVVVVLGPRHSPLFSCASVCVDDQSKKGSSFHVIACIST